MSKEKKWQGYYSTYFARASEQKITVLELLDKEWYDGRETAKCVLPYLTEDSVVLEIACGIGRVGRYVAPNCKSLFCTDILEEALNSARKNLKEFQNVIYKQTNGYDLREFEEDFFDCVYSFTAFFHFDFELVVSYFGEITRVLKPGGTAIIEFKKWKCRQDVTRLLNKIERRGGIKQYENELDKWRFVSKESVQVLSEYYDLQVIDDDVTRFTVKKCCT